MIDLTKIREPFGLLDKETQKALIEHGGPYERYSLDNEWEAVDSLTRVGWPATVYRVKSEPPKPREWWINVYVDHAGHLYAGQLHSTLSKADALGNLRLECVRVREVI